MRNIVRPLSVGTRWTLRYSLAMLVTVCIMAVLVYDRVERRILQDAKLLLELQVAEVVEALERYREDPSGLQEWVEHKVAVGEFTVGLGIALFDPEGVTRWAAGVLEPHRLAVPPEVSSGLEDEFFYEVPLDRRYPYFVMAVPVADDVLQVAIYSRPFARRAGHIGKVFRIAIPVVLLLTAGSGWWLARRALKPIAEITGTARRITGSHLAEWVPVRGTGDELDQLAETLNEMLGRVRAGMERSREFQTRLARELRAPLLALQREIAGLENDTGLSELGRRRMRRALEDAAALGDAVHSMLRLAWSEAGRAPGASVEVPLTVLVEGAAANVGPAAERRGVALRLGPLEKLSVSGDPFWLHELLDGVMDAAMTNAPPGGIVSVSAVKLADSAAIRVSHAEPEEPRTVPTPPEAAADAHRLTARARLTLAREIARAHGGQLEEERRSDTEAEYRLSLPRRNE